MKNLEEFGSGQIPDKTNRVLPLPCASCLNGFRQFSERGFL